MRQEEGVPAREALEAWLIQNPLQVQLGIPSCAKP